MGQAFQQRDNDIHFHINSIGIESGNHNEKYQQQMFLKYLWHRVITNNKKSSAVIRQFYMSVYQEISCKMHVYQERKHPAICLLRKLQHVLGP